MQGLGAHHPLVLRCRSAAVGCHRSEPWGSDAPPPIHFKFAEWIIGLLHSDRGAIKKTTELVVGRNLQDSKEKNSEER